MDIALVFPPSTFLTDPLVWPPLGLFYLAAQLEAQGHHTDFFDFAVSDLAFPKDGDFDQLWISATSPQMFEVRKMADKTISWTKTKTVFGGAAPWANPKSALELGFNLVVSGEADHPDTIKKIIGYAYRDHGIIYPEISKNLEWVLPPVRRWTTNYHSYMKDRKGDPRRMMSLFTSRGCPMECAFCIEENQRILMSDWSWKPIKDIRVGDIVMSMNGGKGSGGIEPIIVPTKVLNVWNKGIQDTIIVSDEKSSIQLTPNHKIYAYDGNDTRWKRSDSIIPNKYKFGKFYPVDRDTDEFKRGWLAGYIAGDGCIHKRVGKTNITITSRDTEMLDVLQSTAKKFGCNLRRFQHKMGNSIFPTRLDSVYIDGLQCTNGTESDRFLAIISESDILSDDYCAGWLAGMYDSDGTLDVGGSCRIFQSWEKKSQNVEKLYEYLDILDIHYNIQYREQGQLLFIMNQREFLTICRPMMTRKYPDKFYYRSMDKTVANKNIDGGLATVFDIETETHTFICEGFVVHNCESGRHGVIWDRLTRYEPLWSVEHQIREGFDLGFDGLAYYDDIFIVNKKRTLQLIDLHKKYNAVFRCFLRSDILCKHGGRDYLKELVDGGLIEVFVGVESADNRIKENIHKGTTIEQDTAVLEWCKELGVTCKMSFILGLPGESLESLNATRDWILKNRPHIVQVDRLIPFPGTPLTTHAEQYDLTYETQIEEEWFFRGRHDINSKSFVSTSNLSVEDIDAFWHKLEKELIAEGLSGYNH